METNRLRLRCVTVDDAASISGMMTPSVSQWLISWPTPFTLEMAVDRIEKARDAFLKRTMLPFAMERRSDAALLGWVSISCGNADTRRALLSYWIGSQYHGEGYMREAVSILVPAAFRMLDVDVIEAAAQPLNEPSRAVLQGCGMTFVGEQMIFAPARNREEISVVYEIVRSELQTSTKRHHS